MARGRVAVLLLVLALAGCAAPMQEPGTPGPAAMPEPSSTPAADAPSPALAPVPLNETRTLQLDGCVGWGAAITYPGPTSPGGRPEGWGPAGPDAVVSAVNLQAYRCDRISVGEFERGPIHLLVEGHTNADFPPACLANDPDQIALSKVATQVWLDDGEVGAYLRDEYGAPVTLGEFTETDQDLAATATHTWTWSAAGGLPSTLTLTDDKGNATAHPFYERYFWANGATGLVQLDLAPTGSGAHGSLPGYGALKPPTRFAEDTGGAFAGMTDWYSQRAAAGMFTMYSDRLCEHRIP